MKAIVVYESMWGNTAAVARAIAEGIGEGAEALTTTAATPERVTGADLIVAGAPLMAFSAPRKSTRDDLAKNPGKAPRPPDLSHPSIRDWLASVPSGTAGYAAFETRFKVSPGSATRVIAKGLEGAGYREIAKAERFIITGTYGPMKDGELDRARAWGQTLAAAR